MTDSNRPPTQMEFGLIYAAIVTVAVVLLVISGCDGGVRRDEVRAAFDERDEIIAGVVKRMVEIEAKISTPPLKAIETK